MKLAQLLPIFLIILIDQFTKLLGVKYLPLYQINTGMALSIFSGSNFLSLAFGLLVVIAVSIYFWDFTRKKKQLVTPLLTKIHNISLLVIISGGLSNICDRIFYQGVVDFIAIGPLPRFNLADFCVTFGVIAWALTVVFNHFYNEKLYSKS